MMEPHSLNPRIVLYSHDTMGLGHIRRNLLISQVLSKSHLQPNILLVCGALEAENFCMGRGVDCTVLPALYKERDGSYRSRRLRMPLDEVISLRRKILYSSISAFDPDVLIVDGVPWGALGELDSTLEYLHARRRTRCVLGMRDVWDEPAVVQLEWYQRKNWDAIRRYYDQIWIYGDPTVYDPVYEYSIPPDVVGKVRYTGYLDQGLRLEFTERKDSDRAEQRLEPLDGHFALCLVGGGQDGARLAETFIEARLPSGSNGVLVTGPHMDPDVRQHLYGLSEGNHHLRVLSFIPEPAFLVQHADCVVAMGGYNTICEIMSFRKRALIVPRVVPRKEQLIRAQRLHGVGALDLLHPDNLQPPAITNWLEGNMGQPPPNFHIDMNGLERLPLLLEVLLSKTHFTGTNSRIQRETL